jgi:hypothetical protein
LRKAGFLPEPGYFIYDLFFKYLPAILSANEDRIIKTVVIRSFIIIMFRSELLSPLPGDVMTSNTPKIPKITEAEINILVATFCILLVYPKIKEDLIENTLPT